MLNLKYICHGNSVNLCSSSNPQMDLRIIKLTLIFGFLKVVSLRDASIFWASSLKAFVEPGYSAFSEGEIHLDTLKLLTELLKMTSQFLNMVVMALHFYCS